MPDYTQKGWPQRVRELISVSNDGFVSEARDGTRPALTATAGACTRARRRIVASSERAVERDPVRGNGSFASTAAPEGRIIPVARNVIGSLDRLRCDEGAVSFL